MSLKDEEIKELKEILNRWTEEIIPSREDFLNAIQSGGKLTIYHGVDPTAPNLHLGHSTNYLLMKKLQLAGQKIVLVVGDFTARIGDPSGRTKERVPLSKEQVRENGRTYQEQISKILDFKSADNPIEARYNSEWLSELTLEKILNLASNFTVQQMLARDMFQRRLKNESPIGMHEFFYPLLQGYDSVALETDAEIGGSDQLFNMLMGRELVKKYLKKDKFVITTKLLINPKTGNKLMSKSEGNYIALNDGAGDMYGKAMALPDEVVKACFELCTEAVTEEIEEIMKLSPYTAKAKLAYRMVAMYHSQDEAKKAQEEFGRIFSGDELPQDIPAVKISVKTKNIVDLLIETELVSSKSEARRLIEQGGVKLDGRLKEDPRETIAIQQGQVLQIGRRRFVRITT